MILILLILGLSFAFYKLADSHDRNGWAYFIIGPATWFGTQFIAGIGIRFISPQLFTDTMNIVIIGMGTGLIGTIVCYMLIKSHFEKNPKKTNRYKKDDLLDN